MPMDVSLYGNAGNVAGITSNNEVKVSLSTGINDPNTVGGVVTFQENDTGEKTGTRYIKSAETSQDYRLRVGLDTLLFHDTFNATSQNTNLWKHAFTTMTMTQSAGFLNINAAGTSTVASNFAYLQSWRYFPLLGTSPLAAEFTAQFTAYPVANEIIQIGFGVATGAADPVDGCWLEFTSAGLYGVIRYNSGVATKQLLIANLTDLSLNANYKFAVVAGEREIEYWIDDVLYGEQLIPAGQGQPFMTTSLPLFMQKYNSGTIGSSPNVIFKVGDVVVTLMDLNANQTWANQMASCGLGMVGLNGGTMGSGMVQWNNTALPAAAAGTNTTAALGAFLGGIFQLNAPATSATDVIIASWQNPIGGVNQTPRTMKIRGLKIDCINTVAAVATTGTTFAIAAAWGGTALTLAQAETGSFVTATAKARRIQPLGVISFPVGAAIGSVASPIQFDFEAPLVINPGEYIQIIAKTILGTATATEVFTFVISPNLYHE